jgi:aldehyde dehydrogenase (NAD+)
VVPDIDRIHAAQARAMRESGPLSFEQRLRGLRAIEEALLRRRDEIRAACWEDLRKPAEEVDLSEIFAVIGETRHARRHLKRWMKPRRVSGRLALVPSSSRIVYEPKGIVLIIAPWNFPVNLSLGPLVSAIAAGNRAVVKPSEITPTVSRLIKSLLGDLFDESEVAVVEGDATASQALLAKRFDHIFFTGSSAVGREVMRAAANHLTSVTLELGGKSPAIVDRTAQIGDAASRIAWGKLLNSGQTCIAPDYLLVDEAVAEPFTRRLIEEIEHLTGQSTGVMVTEAHAARVRRLLESATDAGARIVYRGKTTDSQRTVPVTLVSDVPPDSPLMQEEIFGPVLPMLTYRYLGDALKVVNEREKPLVLYVFTRSRDVRDEVLNRTSAGGTVINHTLIHFYQLSLPFGGVGMSGSGKAHGFAGFEAFSNARAVLDQRIRLTSTLLLFPPYTAFKRKVIDLVLKYL